MIKKLWGQLHSLLPGGSQLVRSALEQAVFICVCAFKNISLPVSMI